MQALQYFLSSQPITPGQSCVHIAFLYCSYKAASKQLVLVFLQENKAKIKIKENKILINFINKNWNTLKNNFAISSVKSCV
jgi:hypothetical protein